MNLTTLKNLYNLLVTSDNMSEIRAALHKNCDHINFESVMSEYVASNDVIMMINYIKKQYDSLIEAEKTVYKISDEELETRKNKLKKAAEIYEKTTNPYIRLDQMIKLFKTPSLMHKSYVLLIRYGKDDPKLDDIRELLKDFSIYYNEFRINYKNDIRRTIANANEDNEEYKKEKYANFIINEYINSDIFLPIEFYNKYNIDSKIFKECINRIRKDKSLYYEFVIKKHENEAKLKQVNKDILTDLNFAISNGYFVYGNSFDIFEFIKKVPFKDAEDFMYEIDLFLSINMPNAKETIINYIKENGLDNKDSFKTVEIDNIINARVIINGTTIEKEDLKRITNYLNFRNIPINKVSLKIACEKYLNNELEEKYLNTKPYTKQRKAPIIIPSKKDAI